MYETEYLFKAVFYAFLLIVILILSHRVGIYDGPVSLKHNSLIYRA